MDTQTATTEQTCPRSALAAYLDGELAPREELVLEMHLAVCQICRTELNQQKKLLCALDFALEEKDEIEVPKDFAKTVAVRAESNVSGLRNRSERPTALFLCASLFLFALVGLGAETERLTAAFFKISEKILAVAAFSAHLVYDISFGTVVILRSLSQQVFFNTAALFGFAGVVCIISIIAFSRIYARVNRS